MQTQEDGDTAYGINYFIRGVNCCTKGKTLDATEAEGAYEVIIPPVEDLQLRTACCCYYCGFNCNPDYNPIGIAADVQNCCYTLKGGASVMTGETLLRSLCSCNDLRTCCLCEDESGKETNGECVLCETSTRYTSLCCIFMAFADKTSCCPQPFACCSEKTQQCCLFGKCAFPCNEFVPCEVGLCGIFCIEKKEDIMASEQKVRDAKVANQPVEAVVVSSKGGAPPDSEGMDR
jgi:hypothetical protein